MPPEIGCVYWRTTAAPCASLVTPWYLGITSTPPQYFREAPLRKATSLPHHFEPPADTFTTDPALAWWKFKTLQDVVYESLDSCVARVRTAQAGLEGELFERQPIVEQKALELWQTDRNTALQYVTRYCSDTAARACREADRLVAKLASPIPATPRSKTPTFSRRR
jgi:dipeptidase